jgi:hypothetical protein
VALKDFDSFPFNPMDRVLPPELLYLITQYSKAKAYVHLRICSSLTLRLRELIYVDFDEYQDLTVPAEDTYHSFNPFGSRHIIRPRNRSINDTSFFYVAEKRHSFELLRIIKSHHWANISRESKLFAFELALSTCREQSEVILALLGWLGITTFYQSLHGSMRFNIPAGRVIIIR